MRCKWLLVAVALSLAVPLSTGAEVIDKPVRSIEILNNPSHDSELGQPPYLEGLRARVTFLDGAEYIATYEDFTVERYDPSQEGSQLVALRYGQYPTQITINVRQSRVSRFDVRLENENRYIGDRLTKDDFRVTVYYDTGRNQEVKDYSISVGVLSEESNKVVIQWGDMTQELNVNALKNTCTDLQVETPGRDEFRVNESFTTEGLVVKATFKNGYTKDVTDSCEILPPDMSREQNFDVRIKYDGRETSYRVRIAEFSFEYADMSEYRENGVAYLYFKNKEKPIQVKDTVWYTDDYSTGIRNFTIHYDGEVYHAEEPIPEDEMRFVGSTRVRVQVPIGINVISDDEGVLGFVRRAELQNLGDTNVTLHVTMLSAPEQLSGVPQSITLPVGDRTVFSLDIRHEKVYDIETKYFRPFDVVLEVPGE